MQKDMRIELNHPDNLPSRHNSPSNKEIVEMLEAIDCPNLEQLIDETIPVSIRRTNSLQLPPALSESEYLKKAKKMAGKNKVFNSFLGQGYYNCHVPTVIARNVLENPAWYTAYTPYQAEIAQGRMEALINFQTMVTELTGMEIANASLLDEGTAAAEAMSMFWSSRKGAKKQAEKFLVDRRVFPQVIQVMKTRAESLGIDLIVTDIDKHDLSDETIFGIYFQYPDDNGAIINRKNLVATTSENNIFTAVGSDLMALLLLEAPGKWGVDVVVGTSQRFGVPFGYGGPHAAFFATKEQFKRSVPGRIIGVSKDSEGNDAYRMALQTREQHIKRERATSNICTAQVLLAVMSSMYTVYHGPERLREIALNIHGLARVLSDGFANLGLAIESERFFDTIKVKDLDTTKVKAASESRSINLRYYSDGGVGISIDETHSVEDIQTLLEIFGEVKGRPAPSVMTEINLDEDDFREVDYLQHPVFNSYHSEHEMLRYMKRLESKDLSLVHSMIPLGSCTMKLNATSEMIPISLEGFSSIHPFAPKDQVLGYDELINELNEWLSDITGFSKVSFQPNSGAQGEYTGLMVIRAYLHDKGDTQRNIALIPSSAHGTNPASAVMAGMKVVIVACDEQGNVDLEDLKAKAEEHKNDLAALMVTYPSTHGVFEEDIKEICATIHENGGLVYMDGANLNAQVGLTSPGLIGADVCHLNLHKTFCIPHGGGGPGMGPIGVVERLVPFLPSEEKNRVSSAEFGSAGILPISHAYINMMGADGLLDATRVAILNANYIAKRLENHYPILYKGKKGRSAHEMIIDCRPFKKIGVEVEDIAKRMMDYGYHAPTVSFPVAGTMMIEPTESETKAELDRFCDVMISIKNEIDEIATGAADSENNVLKNAPHTHSLLLSDEWNKPYSREKAAYPLTSLKSNKFWPSVGRIDSAYGDRNLYCSCIPVDQYKEESVEA